MPRLESLAASAGGRGIVWAQNLKNKTKLQELESYGIDAREQTGIRKLKLHSYEK